MGKIYPGDTITKTLTFKDETGTTIDPTVINIFFYDSAGASQGSQTILDLDRVDRGIYTMLYDVPDPAVKGEWTYSVTAVLAGVDNTEIFSFYVNAVTDRPYGELDTVKNLLLISLTETSFDDQLDTVIATADNFINIALERCGATVPLTSPGDVIRDISNYLAAGFYKQRDVPDEKVHSFYTIGINLLNEYIADNYPAAHLVPAISPPETETSSTNLTLAYNVGTAT
jgi:hypothetical protein